MKEKFLLYILGRNGLSDGYLQLEGFRIDIPDINTSLVVE
jgi:hypothetical protein